MENASKALIIAASILLAIMIVALGVTIFNKAQSSADTTNLDIAEINMFNGNFERYANNQSGSQVKSLISYAISNASTKKDDPAFLPTVVLKDSKYFGNNAEGKNADYITVLGNMRSVITSTHTYEVNLHYADTGLIDTITINY